MFPDVGDATVSVLERLGQDVDLPLAQTWAWCPTATTTTTTSSSMPRRSS
jgi:hypothetical protein